VGVFTISRTCIVQCGGGVEPLMGKEKGAVIYTAPLKEVKC